MGIREKTTTGNHDEGTTDHQTTLPFPPLNSSLLRTAKVHQQWGAHCSGWLWAHRTLIWERLAATSYRIVPNCTQAQSGRPGPEVPNL